MLDQANSEKDVQLKKENGAVCEKDVQLKKENGAVWHSANLKLQLWS